MTTQEASAWASIWAKTSPTWDPSLFPQSFKSEAALAVSQGQRQIDHKGLHACLTKTQSRHRHPAGGEGTLPRRQPQLLGQRL